MPVSVAQGQGFFRGQDYYRDVIALSEILGKAHAVRLICNGRNDQYWRGYMQKLLDLEAPYEGGLRRSMVNGFNAGFSTASSEYQSCDSRAVAAEKSLAQDGKALTDQLVLGNIPNRTGRIEDFD